MARLARPTPIRCKRGSRRRRSVYCGRVAIPRWGVVRERMGGGSPNSVAPALQRWRYAFAAQLDANTGSALEVLPPGVLEIMRSLWSRALFEAHRVRADTPSETEALDQLHSAIADLRDQAAKLQAREAHLDAQGRELDQRRRRLAETESLLARRLAAVTSRRRAAVALPKRRTVKKKEPAPSVKRRAKPEKLSGWSDGAE